MKDELAQQATDKYRMLFSSMDEGYLLADVIFDENDQPVDIFYVEANPSATRMVGQDFTGRRLREIDPNYEAYWYEIFGRVAQTGKGERLEQYAAPDKKWYDFYVFKVGDENSRQVAVVFNDITDRKRRELNAAFLAEIGDDFACFSSPDDLMTAVGEKMTRYFGLSRLTFSDVDEVADEVTAIYENREPHLIRSALEPQRLSAFVSEDFMREMKAGRAIAINDVTTEPRTAAIAEAFKAFGVGAQLHAPFVREGRWSFIITMQKCEPYNWRADQIELLEQLAAQVYLRLDRARAEVALRESEERFRLLVTASSDTVYKMSADWSEMRSLVGKEFIASTENLSHTWLEKYIPQDDQPQVLATIREAIRTKSTFELEHRVIRLDGTVGWTFSRAIPVLNAQGEVIEWIGAASDVTERKQAEVARRESEQRLSVIFAQAAVGLSAAREEERQRAEALAELDRAKTVFFSNVSHEFRTPLTLVLATLQDALSDRTHPLAPPQRERLELAHRNSFRLLKLVNTLLDFSRIEAGRMEAVYEPTDLALFTAELASVFRSAFERAGLRLVVDCPPLPSAVYVDQEMWEKIVLNLLSNAFKFTFAGEIAVRLHPADRDQVILQIQDTGTGIAPEHLPHLFERFYQVRGAQARTHEGAGIGLALVHELIQLHSGTIDVSSTMGQGTCFTISIPLGSAHLPYDRLQHDVGDRTHVTRTLASTVIGKAPYVEEAERWLATDGKADETDNCSTLSASSAIKFAAIVLLVDDNADMREYLRRILSEHVEVIAVADGAAALVAIQERVPDLVLSDVMMPGLDGFQLLQALRASLRTREIPIILLSARAGVEALVKGLEAGADDYLIKPFSAAELVSRVNAHLQMAQLRSVALQQERTISRRKDELLSIVSHELNTPLVSILGWTRLLRANPPSPSMLTKALDTIERNATLQAKLVQDLLDISRITAGKLRLNPQPVELESVIETAIATVAQTAVAKGIDLVWQETTALQDTDSLVVMGDSDRLGQVICNLLTNAIKFTPESGSVTVDLSVIKDDNSPNASYAQIRVVDTGIGIAADFLSHVFDRFRQAEGSTSAKGLGLGLAIARHLVELHNGTIHAQSSGVGQGATFIVRLPLLKTSNQ